jgi:epoxyqueuosine reductase
MSLAVEVKEFSKKIGADLIGIASVERFEEAPEGHRPQDLLPDAQSVIVLAKRIPYSVIQTIPSPYYSSTCSNINNQLRVLTYNITLFIEELGFKALPVDPAISDFARHVEIIRENPSPEIKMLGDFSHRHAAVMAGLGEISAASYVVVPELGPRVRFVSVISTAPLEPDPLTSCNICRPDSCGLACIQACPPKALKGDSTIDHFKCRNYRHPEIYNIEYFKDIASLCSREIPLIRKISILSRKHSSLGLETCGACIKACPIGVAF